MEPRLPEDLLADDAFLRRLSRRLVRDVHAAEDAAQSTWALALARERRPGMPLRAWLAAVLRNWVRQVRRTNERRRHREQRAARRDGELAASDIVERESARRAVLDVVLELPAAPRAAVLARFYEDLSHRAAARQLGVPLDTYRSQLKRGLQLLRERLDRRYDGETRRWYLALLPIAAQSQNSLREIAHMQAMKLLVAGVVAAVGLTLALRAQRSSSADGARDPFDPPQVVRAESGTSRDEPQRQPLAPARPDGERDGVAPDGSPSGTLVVHVRLVDGRPAPQVGVSATPWLAPQQGLFRRDGVTDAEGMVRLDGVAARRIEILVNPELMAKEVTVEAGEEREVTIALRAGLFRVEGVVVDEQDRPVASAEIWHGTEANGTQGMIVARSAADGTFRLPAVGMYDLLAARCTGHAPSLALDVTKSVGRKGDVAHVKLALRGAGGAVRGRVLDAAGAPIVGAVVELGEPSTSAGGWMMTAPPVHTSSGAGGAFVVEGLPPGSVRLLAGAPGYAVRTMRTDVVAGVTTSIEVVLTSGATIRGRTTHPSGAPVPALIYVHDLNADPLLVSIERSDANGAFVVEHVAPGSVPLIAQDASGSLSINDTVRVEEGQTLEWNPVLPEGAVIRGQLRDERDAPLAGWKVCAMSFDPPDAIGRASTGADGRFVLNGLASHAYALTFAGDAALPMETWWIIEHVQPGDDVVVRFPDRARPSAILKGTLLDANLDPPGTVAASIHMERDKFPVGTFAVDADTGEFTIGPLSPATYRVHAWLRNHKSKDFTVTLDVDQVLDLGEIELER